jgi:hypothetical protein
MTASAETISARGAAPLPRQRRARLSAGLAAVAEAREHVRAAIRDWALPVSSDIAVLATWDLVTSLLTEGPGGADGTEGPAGSGSRAHGSPAEGRCGPFLYGTITPGMVTLGISGERGRLRVDAFDGRRYRGGTPGLAIVASLADDWGRYRTPGGRAAYFTLNFSIPFLAEIHDAVSSDAAILGLADNSKKRSLFAVADQADQPERPAPADTSAD